MKLTLRQQQVVKLIAAGTPNKSIAAALEVTNSTVKNHISHIMFALHARDRAAVVSKAYQLGLLTVPRRPWSQRLRTQGPCRHRVGQPTV